MANRVSIIMYHYVRDLAHSKYPEIKGLDVSLFKEQLHYILKHYTVIRMEELLAALKNKSQLPKNALLLTFDDAYKDHVEQVLPVLSGLGVQGSFFIPAKTIVEHRVLDVNKIHFILAMVHDKQELIKDIFTLLDKYRSEYALEANEVYYKRLATEHRFDVPDVVFIKRILQRDLPERLRMILANELFEKYVTKNEGEFSRQLYLNYDDLKHMRKKGMFVGSHGFDHYWLNTLTKEVQSREVELSLDFLQTLGCNVQEFVFCYPYGAYDDSLLSVLKEKGCGAAFTTIVGIADLDRDNPLLLPRLDTNDLPKDRNASPNAWTLQIL
ncbi:MAG: polysaccharide deacetylase family protein [Nanoarchaeota archaeon]